ncbi:type I glyceraldehyde-3-phosphate dehydrogenase [Haloechinothrix sp. LS1_15]|uniref:type I glyceraldehyde-3-phosphate dehydrogenase n=1 Tax=Haloechinothrix sp. LS1_15 TaxID=2652248 RepID=UPI00294421B1|nr:type I glyceraldehyde-3-phosphate dehydrogenase [Haloechinothrix sp. LS1_15]MDV6014245.1 type I glyceraldehyde-3-phosphate dehydrogenase [Haloechinothrix sp. LS1_15]
MTVRVGINGLGRIGRMVLRRVLTSDTDVEVVGINDVAPVAELAHLLAYDSTYGPLDRHVYSVPDAIVVDGTTIPVSACREPERIGWRAVGADVVIESSGLFRTREQAGGHLKGGASRVLISAPGKDVDFTVVMGVNGDQYDADVHEVISNASCTTNCVAPMVKVLDDAFGVSKAFMTTVHGYTNDQVVLDAPHKDLRRARSAGVNIIPTSTGAARATGHVLPDLEGRIDGAAMRVPVDDGSLTDLTVLLTREVTADEVNEAFANAAAGELSGIVRYTDHPIVSRDIIGDPASCVFDSLLTQVNGNFVKVFGWYDNEWGYACRLVEFAEHIGQ